MDDLGSDDGSWWENVRTVAAHSHFFGKNKILDAHLTGEDLLPLPLEVSLHLVFSQNRVSGVLILEGTCERSLVLKMSDRTFCSTLETAGQESRRIVSMPLASIVGFV